MLLFNRRCSTAIPISSCLRHLASTLNVNEDKEQSAETNTNTDTGTSTDSSIETSTKSGHVPAPSVWKPTVSPITDLGKEMELITSLGAEQEQEEEQEEEEGKRVITWMGDFPSEVPVKEMEAPKEVPIKKKELTPIHELAFELIPRFVKRNKPKKLTQEEAVDVLEALDKVMEEAPKKLTGTLQVGICLGVDPRKSDQFVRGISYLPHGTGQKISIAVFAEGIQAQRAKEMGADLVGGVQLIQEILDSQGNNVKHIKRCLATPSMMKELTKAGRILGPRGLMPNPKMGTLTENIVEAMEKLQKGQIEFRIDRFGNLQTPLGKLNYGREKLLENLLIFGKDVLQSKPKNFGSKGKKRFITSMTISATGGRGFPIFVQSVMRLVKSQHSS